MVSEIRFPPPGANDQRVLHQQGIDETGPGTVLADFETLRRFIGQAGSSGGIPVSGGYDLLPMKSLAQLNAQMSHPIETALKRPQQKSYPHIHGLYLLLRATGLTQVERARTGGRLLLDDAALRSWRSLNPTERYFTLLEAWLLRGRPQILGEQRGWLDLPILNWAEFFRRIPAQGLELAGSKDQESFINYYPGLYTVALLEMFGFITVQDDKPQEGKGWRIAGVRQTVLGKAMLRLLSHHLLRDEAPWLDDSEMDSAFGELQAVVQPYFPEWRQNLVITEVGFQDGSYIFKVSLGKKVWRRIAIAGSDVFESLSDAILQAFAFDNDHLYRFTYKNRFGVSVGINHPYMDESPFTTEVQIGGIGIKPGGALSYLFDFGDQWGFTLELEAINPADPKIKRPVILETHGEAPKQYPDSPDWDE